MPYYAWECLCIELPNRNVDLIIKNENDMINLISLLIWRTETINGVAGTSLAITNLMRQERKQVLYTKVLIKYKIMKIRMKISYEALRKRITIKELFYRAII